MYGADCTCGRDSRLGPSSRLAKAGFLEEGALKEDEDCKAWLWELAARKAKSPSEE